MITFGYIDRNGVFGIRWKPLFFSLYACTVTKLIWLHIGKTQMWSGPWSRDLVNVWWQSNLSIINNRDTWKPRNTRIALVSLENGFTTVMTIIILPCILPLDDSNQFYISDHINKLSRTYRMGMGFIHYQFVQ